MIAPEPMPTEGPKGWSVLPAGVPPPHPPATGDGVGLDWKGALELLGTLIAPYGEGGSWGDTELLSVELGPL